MWLNPTITGFFFSPVYPQYITMIRKFEMDNRFTGKGKMLAMYVCSIKGNQNFSAKDLKCIILKIMKAFISNILSLIHI